MERKHSRNIESMVERETAEKSKREKKKKKIEVELNFQFKKNAAIQGARRAAIHGILRGGNYIAACVPTCSSTSFISTIQP